MEEDDSDNYIATRVGLQGCTTLLFVFNITHYGDLSYENGVTDFMKSRHMEEHMVQDRNLRRLGMDREILDI